MSEIIKITKSAGEYLAKLIQDKNAELDLSIRIFISDPGNSKAETCLLICKPEEAMPDDLIINLESINVNIEKRKLSKKTVVNFDNDTFGGQLYNKST